MISASLGKAVFTPKKNYRAGQQCEPMDVVSYNGAAWICLDRTTQVPAPGATDWMMLVDGGFMLCEFYMWRHPTLKPGFQPAMGGVIQNAPALYPEAWDYLQTPEGAQLCVSWADWQAMNTAEFYKLADGTSIGWNGIGGVPYYALNTATGEMRLPDIRGMYAEAAGYDSLGVGGRHGDGQRLVRASWMSGWVHGFVPIIAPLEAAYVTNETAGAIEGSATIVSEQPYRAWIDNSRVTPVAAQNQPRAWGALPCVYLGATR